MPFLLTHTFESLTCLTLSSSGARSIYLKKRQKKGSRTNLKILPLWPELHNDMDLFIFCQKTIIWRVMILWSFPTCGTNGKRKRKDFTARRETNFLILLEGKRIWNSFYKGFQTCNK